MKIKQLKVSAVNTGIFCKSAAIHEKINTPPPPVFTNMVRSQAFTSSNKAFHNTSYSRKNVTKQAIHKKRSKNVHKKSPAIRCTQAHFRHPIPTSVIVVAISTVLQEILTRLWHLRV